MTAQDGHGDAEPAPTDETRRSEQDDLQLEDAKQDGSSETSPQDSDSNDEGPSEAQQSIWAKPGQLLAIAVVALLGILLILWAFRIWPFTSSIVETNDSYVQGQVTLLSPQVSGYVTKIEFTDYQYVRAGQILFRIDPRLYQAAVDQAAAQVEASLATLANATQTIAQDRAMITQRIADVSAADAATARDLKESERVDGLASRGSVSEREREQAEAAAKASMADATKSRAALAVAREQVTLTQVSKKGLQADVDKARAQLETATINLANTIIRAPVAGQVSQASVRAGQFVAAGTQLIYLVPREIWVIANFKETDMQYMAVGQPATLSIDLLGEDRLRGRVVQIAPATGTEFSVLKPDNASGNFTKVVRRLPVRIGIEANQPLARRLRPGLSVVTRVDTTSGRNDGKRRGSDRPVR